MIYLDSWILIEYFSENEHWRKVEDILKRVLEEGAVISTIVLTEVSYRIQQKFGKKKSEEVLRTIEAIENLKILPVTKEVAIIATNLRIKYYSKQKPVSYGDMIHLATAILSRCKILYSGDPDFKNIEEIKTEIVT
ncbi:MAG: type II toxin-antitoxin system VapC family toxin [Candidatus Wukongarchaeota archaeon]|nr:PIN domain-containing protein [Candidatus Wukongarchaeota archaeon]